MTQQEFLSLRVGGTIKLSKIVFDKTNEELAKLYYANSGISIDVRYFDNLRKRSKKSLYLKIIDIENDHLALGKPYKGMYLPFGACFLFDKIPIEYKINKLLKL